MAKRRKNSTAKGRERRASGKVPPKVLAGHRKIWGGTIPAGALEALRAAYANKPKRNPKKRRNITTDYREGVHYASSNRTPSGRHERVGPKRKTRKEAERDQKIFHRAIAGKKRNPARRKKKRPSSPKRAMRPATSSVRAMRQGGRRNPDAELAAAGRMYKRFTGKKPTRVRLVDESRSLPSTLADCGRLVELHFKRPGFADVLRFPEGSKQVRVGTPGDGKDLYFVGGDQEIPASQFGPLKNQMDLGAVTKIVYFTSKDFHNFEPTEYSHKFGEILRGGARVMAGDAVLPRLGYDAPSKRLYLVGGSYRVERAGIVK